MKLNIMTFFNEVETLSPIYHLCVFLSGCNDFLIELLLGPPGHQLLP